MADSAKTEAPTHQIGCAELPPGMSRDKYFQKLKLLEVGSFATGTPTPKAVRAWRSKSPADARFSLLASAELTGAKSFPTDETGLELTQVLADACETLAAEALVFRTPPAFSPSASNRTRMEKYFGEVATSERFGSTRMVWEPSGLWEPKAISAVAESLNLLVAIDPLAKDPLDEQAAFVAEQMARGPAYLRIHGMGISRRRFEPYQLEMLVEMLEALEKSWVIFAHQGKYPDALATARGVAMAFVDHEAFQDE